MKNICKFTINIIESDLRKNVKDHLKGAFDKYRKDEEDNSEKVWDKQGKNLKAIFTVDKLITYRSAKGITYFLLTSNSDYNGNDQITIDVICIVNNIELTRAVYLVFEDIKNVVNSDHLYCEYAEEKKVYIYLTNNNDISEEAISIIAKYETENKSIISKKQLISKIIISGIVLITMLVFIIFKKTTIWAALFGALISTGIEIITDHLINLKYFVKMIVVKDFDQEWFIRNSTVEEAVDELTEIDESIKTPEIPSVEEKK